MATTGDDEIEQNFSELIMNNLKLVIILSGKRKSGKDHISTMIANYITRMEEDHILAILRIAGPIKKEFATNNKLNFDRLLDSSNYKEMYRRAMVDWSERYRAKNGWNCFLEQAIREQGGLQKAIWILNDARRPCDVEYFDCNTNQLFSNARIIKLKIESTDEIRASRGWKFVDGIDNCDTECGLDDYNNWTLIIENNTNDDQESLVKKLQPIYEAIDDALSGLG